MAGSAPMRIPISAARGRAGHSKGTTEIVIDAGLMIPAVITPTAAPMPDRQTIHSGSRHGSAR